MDAQLPLGAWVTPVLFIGVMLIPVVVLATLNPSFREVTFGEKVIITGVVDVIIGGMFFFFTSHAFSSQRVEVGVVTHQFHEDVSCVHTRTVHKDKSSHTEKQHTRDTDYKVRFILGSGHTRERVIDSNVPPGRSPSALWKRMRPGEMRDLGIDYRNPHKREHHPCGDGGPELNVNYPSPNQKYSTQRVFTVGESLDRDGGFDKGMWNAALQKFSFQTLVGANVMMWVHPPDVDPGMLRRGICRKWGAMESRDVVLLLGVDSDNTITSSDVMTWGSDNNRFAIEVRDTLEGLIFNPEDVLPVLGDAMNNHYTIPVLENPRFHWDMSLDWWNWVLMVITGLTLSVVGVNIGMGNSVKNRRFR
jgi:hypothetical protein